MISTDCTVSLNPGLFVCVLSLPDSGSDRHAGGAGDLLRAAAAEAAEEDVLPEEGEAPGPRPHPGARSPVLHHRV